MQRHLLWRSGLAFLSLLVPACVVPKAPVANFSADPLSGLAPLTVQFSDTSAPGSAPITDWHWTLGDGGEETIPSPMHTFTNPGLYDIQLSVSSKDGSDTELRSAYIAVQAPAHRAIITEFMAVNISGRKDEDGDRSDWIELYNPSEQDLPLAGWGLSDDLKNPLKWQFPAITLPAHAFLLVFASGKDRAPLAGELHTSFSLGQSGEGLGLADPVGNWVDIFEPVYSPQYDDVSYGTLDGATGYFYFENPTPENPNAASGAIRGFAANPVLSPPHGFYQNPVSVTVATQPGVSYRYTLDGSEPGTNLGTLYSGPIPLLENHVIRIRSFQTGYWPSPVATATYIFNANTAQRSLPALCISGDQGQSLYAPDGIMAIVGGHYELDNDGDYVWTPDEPADYNNPMQHGAEFERPVAIELIRPADNSSLQTNAGIRIHGGDSLRAAYMTCDNWLNSFRCKFSFRLYFRSEYGAEALTYPLFENATVNRFESLVLRGGHHDAVNPFIKDELARRLFGDMGREFIHGTFVNLFINGEYKAYYNLTERYDEAFFQSWIDPDEQWDVIDPEGPVEGDDTAWKNLIDYASSNNLADPDAYEYVSDRIKVTMFIDYLILQLYIANADWPDNNWVVAREARDGGQFGFYVWDAEYGFRPEYLYANGLYQFPMEQGTGLNGQNDPLAKLYRALKANPEFRAKFSERVHAHFFDDGGALTENNIRARYDALRSPLVTVIPAMDAYIPDHWIPERRNIVLSHFLAEGLYVAR